MVDGPLGKALSAKLPDKGVVVLGFFDLGFRNVTNSKRPITKGEDLDGLKLRVIPNPVFLETFKTFKANPMPMPFAELYGALETKAVDGQENPYAVILSSKFYEVNKYVSGTNHVYATNPCRSASASGTSCRRRSRSCCRTPPSKPRTTSAGQPRRGGQGGGRTQGQGHAVQRVGAGGAGPHARDREAGGREVRRQLRPGHPIPASDSPRALRVGRTALPTPRPAESRGRSGPDPPP